MWRAGQSDPTQVKRLRQARERLDLTPLVIHDNYLINLAAAGERIRDLSIAAFRGELLRTLAIGAEYLVAHPGSFGSQGLEEGIRRLAESLEKAAHGLAGKGLTLLIENTAGGGTRLGGRFEELRAIRDSAIERIDFEVGYCLDTAHCLAAGYDVATARGLRGALREAGQILGLEQVRVIHANDSKAPLGSRLDRHAHIGRGFIGADGLRRILNHPKLRSKPFILETPIDQPGDDRRNIQALKKLCRKKTTTTSKSS